MEIKNKNQEMKEKARFATGLALKTRIEQIFSKWLVDESITEICINRPNEIFYEGAKGWVREEVKEISYDHCEHLAKMLATYRGVTLDKSNPILSGVLPDGQRVQVVIPPACTDKTICFTIRQPSKVRYSMSHYEEMGFFKNIRFADEKADDDLLHLYQNKDWKGFLELAVILGKNIVVAGETGSGKTTFMKTLIDFIPSDERLITIEDTPEINFHKHDNYVQLYYPSEAKKDSTVTASTLLKSCMRMKPDRILITELRSGETFDFIQALSSGHKGSITSCHAGSVTETFDRLGLMVKQNNEGGSLEYQDIQRLLRQTIDIVLHISNHKGNRFIDEAYYKEIYTAQNKI